MKDDRALLQLATQVLCGPPAGTRVGALYLYAQTTDNEDSVFQTAVGMYAAGHAGSILICGSEARNGYPGADGWRCALVSRGIPPSLVHLVPFSATDHLHTRTESQALIRYAKQAELSSLGVTAAPFHQLRAFMTAVTIRMEESADTLLHSFPGAPLPWGEHVVHSQGSLSDTRLGLIDRELEKIRFYQIVGDLAAFADVSAYLLEREAFR